LVPGLWSHDKVSQHVDAILDRLGDGTVKRRLLAQPQIELVRAKVGS